MAKILFLGDLYYDYNIIVNDLDLIVKYINDNNLLCILNLEGPITDSNKKYTHKRGPNLKQSKRVINILKKLNVIGVTLSNNHMYDYREKGIKNTIEVLKKHNIKYCGCGFNFEESIKPMEFEFDSKKVAIYSYGWNIEETHYSKKYKTGCAPLKKEIILNNMAQNTLNIIQLHWGFEFNKYPMPRDILIAHDIIDNGASIIIGHHPHNIQPYENYNGKKIYYSLGNFYFSSRSKIFDQIKLDDQIESFCNYGAGIVYDTNREEVIEILELFYDSKKQKLFFTNNKIMNELKYDENLKYEYIKKAKKYKCNKNPILTGNNFFDRLKILILYLKRFLIKIKYKLGKVLK